MMMEKNLPVKRDTSDLEDTLVILRKKIQPKYIIAQLAPDPWAPYVCSSFKGMMPRIIESTHPEYKVGRRFDLGFLNIAMNEGYAICILPENLDDL